MRVAVVVPTYQRPEMLRGCVRSLLAGERRPDEIVVVGRECDGGTQEAIRELQAEAGERLHSAWVTEPGHIPPVHAGAQAATTELVAFVDDDVTVTPEWLAHLVRHFEDPSVGVVGGRVIVPGAPPPVVRGRPGQLSWYGKFWGNLGSLGGTQPFEVATVMEGNCAWRRDLLASLEFDSVLNSYDARLYGLDLTLQAHRRGFRVLFDPTAEVHHHVAPRSPELDRADRTRKMHSYSRNHSYIQVKHQPWWRRAIFLVWWFLIGERWSPGLGTALVESLRRKSAWSEFAIAWQGKREGVRLARARREAHTSNDGGVAAGRGTAYGEGTAKSYDALRFQDPHGRLFHQLEVKRLEEALESLPVSARILEVGCGTGRFLEHLTARGGASLLVGADASLPMLAQSRPRVADCSNAALVQAEAAKLPFADAQFDLVYSIRVLNQLGTRDYALAAVQEMGRVCKGGGMVLVEFVNRHGLTRKPTVKFSPGEMKHALARLGLRVERTHGVLLLTESVMRRVPRPVLGVYGGVEALLARLLPWWSSRCYVLARRQDNG